MKNAIGCSLALLSAIISPLFSCSNVTITQMPYAITARTLDFPQNTGGVMGFGFVGKKNTSDLNLNPGANAISWISKYNYLGQTWAKDKLLIDGVNEKGLYAAFLYLPNFTTYPEYNAEDPRASLGIDDIVNYVLSTSATVNEALKFLEKVQIVKNGAPINYPDGRKEIVIMPLHVVIRDKTGSAAVLEWIDGETIVYPTAGPVLTNAPTYDWQLKHAEEWDYVSTANTAAKFDGSFMNGSGFLGIPGDWTPPSRFARATQILNHIPAPRSINQALTICLSVLESVQVPLGTNESPTLWKTLIDLSNSIYYYYPMYNTNPTLSWQKYDLKQLMKKNALPDGMVEVYCQPTKDKRVIRDLMQPTEGPASE